MTEEINTTEIRAEHKILLRGDVDGECSCCGQFWGKQCEILDLCDNLEAVRIERDDWMKECSNRGKALFSDVNILFSNVNILSRIRAIHFVTASSAGPGATNCAGCSHDWPCPTIKALES